MSGALTLDAEQDAAVHHGDGPALVIAGPGAGKTRVLTHRVAHLVRDRGINPHAIAVCTFTNKATDEMRERLYQLIGPRTDSLLLGTIHSLCYRLLRSSRGKDQPSYQVAHEGFIVTALSMLLDRPSDRNSLGLDLEARGVSMRDLDRFFSAVRNRLLPADGIDPAVVPELIGRGRWLTFHRVHEEDFIEAFRRFQSAKADKGLVDFEDMAYLLDHAWNTHPLLMNQHQESIHHVLIDEFQDTSYGQFEVLRRLAAPQDNMYAVGDSDQSIYGWRFAEPQYTVGFRTYYPSAAIYHVATNYRSRPAIVHTARSLIRNNTVRIDLDLRPYRDDAGQPCIEVIHPSDTDDEAAMIAQDITRSGNSCAVLYRTNAYSAGIELRLLQHGIPYRILGGLPFFALKPVADMLAYLRLREDPTDAQAFERAASSPNRYLGKAYFQAVERAAGKHGDRLAVAMDSCSSYRQRQSVWELLLVLKHMPSDPSAAVRFIREQTLYDRWFLNRTRDEDDGDGGDTRRVYALDRLEHVAASFSTAAELTAYAEIVVSEAKSEDDSDRVTLCTVHRSKGLEWPHVYLVGFVDGLFPHGRTSTPEQLEEERRIAYVAVTRARERAVLSVPEEIDGRSVEPSPFLAEMGVE